MEAGYGVLMVLHLPSRPVTPRWLSSGFTVLQRILFRRAFADCKFIDTSVDGDLGGDPWRGGELSPVLW
jgi:hypothetical protein